MGIRRVAKTNFCDNRQMDMFPHHFMVGNTITLNFQQKSWTKDDLPLIVYGSLRMKDILVHNFIQNHFDTWNTKQLKQTELEAVCEPTGSSCPVSLTRVPLLIIHWSMTVSKSNLLACNTEVPYRLSLKIYTIYVLVLYKFKNNWKKGLVRWTLVPPQLELCQRKEIQYQEKP